MDRSKSSRKKSITYHLKKKVHQYSYEKTKSIPNDISKFSNNWITIELSLSYFKKHTFNTHHKWNYNKTDRLSL